MRPVECIKMRWRRGSTAGPTAGGIIALPRPSSSIWGRNGKGKWKGLQWEKEWKGKERVEKRKGKRRERDKNGEVGL